jgi:uncharacterized protein
VDVEKNQQVQQDRFRRATEENDTEAIYEIALEYQNRRYYEEAKNWYKKGIELNHLKSRLSYIDLLINQQNFHEAITYLKPIEDKPEGLLYKGYMHFKQQEFDKAIPLLKLAVKNNQIKAARYLAQIMTKTDDFESATYWYGIATDVGDTESMIQLTSLLLSKGKKAKAIDWYKTFIEKYQDRHAYYNYAILKKQEGDFTKAKELFSRAHTNGHHDAAYMLGLISIEEEDWDNAELYFNQAVEKFRHIDATIEIGRVYYLQGNIKKSFDYWMDCYKKGINKVSSSIALWYKSQGDFQQTREWLNKGLKFEDTDSIFHLGVLELESMNLEKAEGYFKELTNIGNINAMVNLATTLLHLEREEEALKWLNKAAELGHPQAIENLKSILENL